jgi:hypothetical protein
MTQREWIIGRWVLVPICFEDEDIDISREGRTYLGDEALPEYRKAESE